MAEPNNGPWFKFLLWSLGISLTAIIGLQTTLYYEIRGKIDRIYIMLDKLGEKLTQHDAELARQREILDHLRRHQ